MVSAYKERLLLKIELEVFGNINIQKKQFEKFCEKNPEYKQFLKIYI